MLIVFVKPLAQKLNVFFVFLHERHVATACKSSQRAFSMRSYIVLATNGVQRSSVPLVIRVGTEISFKRSVTSYE